MAAENAGWGAPKIHGELQKLGFAVSERTVARYLRPLRRRGDPKQRWLAFLTNHREAIVAITVVLGVILDLDRPRRGFIQVSQQPMADLQHQLRAHRPSAEESPPTGSAVPAGK